MYLLFALSSYNLFSVHALSGDASGDEESSGEEGDDPEKRFAFTSAAILTAISVAATAAGTATAQIKDQSVTISNSVKIENFSKWVFAKQGCKAVHGQMSVPFESAFGGQSITLGMRKTRDSAHGIWMACHYKFKNYKFHFMVMQPYNYDRNTNTLAFALTRSSVHYTAEQLYKNPVDITLVRRHYYASLAPLKICNHRMGVCIKGTMGTSYKPSITIRILPIEYDNVSREVKNKLKEKMNDAAESNYKEFIKNEMDRELLFCKSN